jgi:hypothetical protein
LEGHLPASQVPFKFDLADLPQDLSVHRSNFGSLAANITPAHHGGSGVSGNGNGVGSSRSALSPLPVQAHLQSPFAALHQRGGVGGNNQSGKNLWPKDEIQVLYVVSSRFICEFKILMFFFVFF